MSEQWCPHCGVSQQGAPIPEKYLRDGAYGPWDGVTPRHFKRTVGIEVRGAYDGVLFWQCPDCAGRWHRFAPGDRLHERARPYVDGEK